MGEVVATHWTPNSLVEEVGGMRAPSPPLLLEVVVVEKRGLGDQISRQPWLSLELAPLVEEEEEEMVVKEEMCCKQLGGCCSWVW